MLNWFFNFFIELLLNFVKCMIVIQILSKHYVENFADIRMKDVTKVI